MALSGGVGGAKLALGLTKILAHNELTLVVNTADDFEHLGLSISPDIDTLIYTLAGLNNSEQGWGLRGESWQCLDALTGLGGENWFKLGDRDIATHLYRTDALRRGSNLTQVTAALASAMGVAYPILPMSNDKVRTLVETAEGKIAFQEYFVKLRCAPEVRSIEFAFLQQAVPNPAFVEQLNAADLDAVLLCPSNPFVSIDPIVGLRGIRQALCDIDVPVIAVSPIIGRAAVKGPAAKMQAELGYVVSALSVAEYYADFIDALIIDDVDQALAARIEASGVKPIVTKTLMQSLEDKIALAENVVASISML